MEKVIGHWERIASRIENTVATINRELSAIGQTSLENQYRIISEICSLTGDNYEHIIRILGMENPKKLARIKRKETHKDILKKMMGDEE